MAVDLEVVCIWLFGAVGGAGTAVFVLMWSRHMARRALEPLEPVSLEEAARRDGLDSYPTFRTSMGAPAPDDATPDQSP